MTWRFGRNCKLLLRPANISSSLLLRALDYAFRRMRVSQVKQFNALVERLLGIPEDALDKKSGKEIRIKVRDKLRRQPKVTADDVLGAHEILMEVAAHLGLSRAEQLVLLNLVWLKQDPLWREFKSNFGDTSPAEAACLFAAIHGLPYSQVQQALDPQGMLFKVGLIQLGSNRLDDPGSLYEVLDGLNETALRNRKAWTALVARKFSVRDTSKLSIADFTFLEPNLDAVLRVLKGSLENGIKGIHVLLHGKPGTGKTSLAQAIASQLGANLMAVQTQDSEGSEASGLVRVRWLGLGQKLLSGSKKRIFLFDEAEDLFPAHIGVYIGNFGSSSAFYKGWINEMLENTAVPTIWTANNVSWVDRAHLRRFTCIMEVPISPMSVRRRLLVNETRHHDVGPAWVDKMSREEAINPGEIAQLGLILRTTGEKGEKAEALLESMLREKLPVLGARPPRKQNPHGDPCYDVSLLNTTPSIESIIASLQHGGRASALFYGSPGTGKSELVRHLSDALDRPLVVKQASELLSMWVGGTEKNIAEAFKRAERERAILFLDESDSFLRSREMAQRSWEVTQVNELLVGMEQFDGLFIAATNLVDGLDPAAFRRFDIKVRFEPLRLDQKTRLFQSLIHEGASPDARPHAGCSDLLAALDQLTLGDFRAAMRAIRLTGRAARQSELLAALKQEYRFKEEGKHQPIGFVR